MENRIKLAVLKVMEQAERGGFSLEPPRLDIESHSIVNHCNGTDTGQTTDANDRLISLPFCPPSSVAGFRFGHFADHQAPTASDSIRVSRCSDIKILDIAS